MDWLSAFHVLIDYHRRAIVFQVSGKPKLEFLWGNRILNPVVTRARPAGGAHATLYAKEGKIPVVLLFRMCSLRSIAYLQKRP